MPKGLLIKGTNTIIRYDQRYADNERFELIEDVAKHLAAKAKPKRTRKKREVAKPAEETPASDNADDPKLDTLLAELSDGQEDNR